LIDESILIHSGCGGVGQAAIAVCQYYNCNIFTTVGNEEKKHFLMREYNIPEDHIFNSHDIQFEQQIMSKTKGKGVNLVLNSLTGEKLESSFRCVSNDGRFVEIGKYELQMNKQLGMFAFLRNISFHGVAADRLLYFIDNGPQKFFDWMHENSNNGCIKPINRTVFKPTEAEQAFRYMTTGKHIGKIVIKMREEENMRIALKGFNPTIKLNATVKTFFNPKKVYIITGGLGGMGLELLHWMIFNGAKKLVLTSRTGVKTNYQRVIFSRLEDFGKNYEMFKTEIIVLTHNSNSMEGTKQLLDEAKRLGPIGGIFHLAVVLNDALFRNQTIETFHKTCESKINTFANLDKLTRISCPDLDYFVLFSSVTCGKGFRGQSNYGYANSVAERICEMRRRDGLHGLAIQWGPIGDVGLLADDENVDKIAGIVKQRINSCFDVLDKFLQFPDSILLSVVSFLRIFLYFL
jgi:fatty acid synthase